MKTIFTDRTKIDFYSKIQKRLYKLSAKSDDNSIDEIFELIPPHFLEEKENLIMICQLFAMLGRNNAYKFRVVIKLFQRILPLMKTYLKGESSTIWNLFGGLFFLKHWMYEEGLIDINQIILSAISSEISMVTEYFLPEILEKESECFYRELKPRYPIFSDSKAYSAESIEKLREKRKKFFKWIIESSDYSDPSYQEIDSDPLRLSIKTDNIENFQRLISNSNISIDSTIRESVVETFLRYNLDISLIKYAVNYNAVKIFKFLMMKEAKLDNGIISYSIYNGDYEIIHLIESKMKDSFRKSALSQSIMYWKEKITDYVVNNYDFDFLRAENLKNVDKETKGEILDIINDTIDCLNFRFFREFLIPFFTNNPDFISENIYEIIFSSFKDMSCFFTKEFLKFTQIDVNHFVENNNSNFLICAIDENNKMAVELFLKNYDNIDINGLNDPKVAPLYYACGTFTDIKILEDLCSYPNIDINHVVEEFGLNAIQVSILRGNPISTKFLIENYADKLVCDSVSSIFLYCIQNDHLLTMKYFVKFLMDRYKNDKDRKKIILKAEKLFKEQNDFNDIWIDFSKVFGEIGIDVNSYKK